MFSHLRLRIVAGTQLSPARLVIPVAGVHTGLLRDEPASLPFEFERRSAPRRDINAVLAVIQPAVVKAFPPRTMPARLKNISTAGALLVTSTPIVSHRFWLRWSAVDEDGVFDECALVRRDVEPAASDLELGFVCGVRFIRPFTNTKLMRIIDRLQHGRLSS
jgi:hypothetical protein